MYTNITIADVRNPCKMLVAERSRESSIVVLWFVRFAESTMKTKATDIRNLGIYL
jgi:hypothetical protein